MVKGLGGGEAGYDPNQEKSVTEFMWGPTHIYEIAII